MNEIGVEIEKEIGAKIKALSLPRTTRAC